MIPTPHNVFAYSCDCYVHALGASFSCCSDFWMCGHLTHFALCYRLLCELSILQLVEFLGLQTRILHMKAASSFVVSIQTNVFMPITLLQFCHAQVA